MFVYFIFDSTKLLTHVLTRKNIFNKNRLSWPSHPISFYLSRTYIQR